MLLTSGASRSLSRPRRLALWRERCDPQPGDAVARATQDAEAETVEGKALPRLRDRPRFVNDEARNGGRLLVRQVPVHDAVEIADRHAAVDIDRPVRLRPHARHVHVVLIADVAD